MLEYVPGCAGYIYAYKEWHGPVRWGEARLGEAWHGLVWRGEVRHGLVWSGEARQGWARLGEAGQGKAWFLFGDAVNENF